MENRFGPYVHPDVVLGEGAAIGMHSNIGACTIGRDVTIGVMCVIGNDVVIGNRVRIGDLCAITAGVRIEDGVYLEPAVIILNDKYPPSAPSAWQPPVVKRGAIIGGNVTICAGVVIGEEAIIAAGAVVTRNVPPRQVWAGVPAVRLA